MIERNKDWWFPWALGAGILLVVGAAGLYLLRGQPEPEPVVDVARPPVQTPAAPPPAVVDTAPPEPVRTLPLPPLDESDPEVVGGLTEIFGPEAVMQHLVPERIVRNIVVSIDNAPRQQMALNQRPFRATAGEFVTRGSEDDLTLAP